MAATSKQETVSYIKFAIQNIRKTKVGLVFKALNESPTRKHCRPGRSCHPKPCRWCGPPPATRGLMRALEQPQRGPRDRQELEQGRSF